MSSHETSHFQSLLDRLREGDESARPELIAWAYERLRLLARKMLRREFPRMRAASTSVVHQTVLRLLNALETVQPATERDFFNLAARNTRWVLLDLIRQRDKVIPELPLLPDDRSFDRRQDQPVAPSEAPGNLAIWEEFHRQVGELPEKEREVFELIWYGERTQVEVARLLNLHPREVSRRWLRARLILTKAVKGLEDLLDEEG